MAFCTVRKVPHRFPWEKAIEAQPEEMLLAAAFLTVVTVAVCSSGNCSLWGASYGSKTWPGPTPSSVKTSTKTRPIRYISHKVSEILDTYKSIAQFSINLLDTKLQQVVRTSPITAGSSRQRNFSSGHGKRITLIRQSRLITVKRIDNVSSKSLSRRYDKLPKMCWKKRTVNAVCALT